MLDCEVKKRRDRVFNFSMPTISNPLVSNKLDCVFEGLKVAAKVSSNIGFLWKFFEDGPSGSFRARRKKTVLKKASIVCYAEDKNNLKGSLQKKDIIDLCTWKRAISKWRFYQHTIMTVFASLIQDEIMGKSFSVPVERLLRNRIRNFLKVERNTKQPQKSKFLLVQTNCSYGN